MGLVQFRASDDLPFLDLTGEVGVVLALQLQRVVVVVVLDDEALGATAGVVCDVALVDVVVAGRDVGAAVEQAGLDETSFLSIVDGQQLAAHVLGALLRVRQAYAIRLDDLVGGRSRLATVGQGPPGKLPVHHAFGIGRFIGLDAQDLEEPAVQTGVRTVAGEGTLVQPGDGIGGHDGFGGSTCCLRLLVDGDGANHFPAAVVHERASFVVQRSENEAASIGLAGIPGQPGELCGIDGLAFGDLTGAGAIGTVGQLQRRVAGVAVVGLFNAGDLDAGWGTAVFGPPDFVQMVLANLQNLLERGAQR